MSIENLDLNRKENSLEQEKQYIIKALKTIRDAGIFDVEYIENIKLVSYGKNKTILFEHGEIGEITDENFNMSDFMLGRRTDFVGIHPKKEFSDQILEVDKISDRQIIPFMFFKGLLTYDEFIAHEVSHTLFDIEYKKRFGEYAESNGTTDVSEQYKEAVMGKIKNLCLKYFPNLEVERFVFSRQQIAEIFAQLYQREFCKRAGQNVSLHDELFENMKEFLANPQETLDEFNKQKGRNCSMDDFYEENHTLSLVMAPIIEKEFPDFNQRVNSFWNN